MQQSASILPYRCPKCKDASANFSSLTQLKQHLEDQHAYISSNRPRTRSTGSSQDDVESKKNQLKVLKESELCKKTQDRRARVAEVKAGLTRLLSKYDSFEVQPSEGLGPETPGMDQGCHLSQSLPLPESQPQNMVLNSSLPYHRQRQGSPARDGNQYGLNHYNGDGNYPPWSSTNHNINPASHTQPNKSAFTPVHNNDTSSNNPAQMSFRPTQQYFPGSRPSAGDGLSISPSRTAQNTNNHHAKVKPDDTVPNLYMDYMGIVQKSPDGLQGSSVPNVGNQEEVMMKALSQARNHVNNLQKRTQQYSEEQQGTIDKLQGELKRRDRHLDKAKQELGKLTGERVKLQRELLELNKGKDLKDDQMAVYKAELTNKDMLVKYKEREIDELKKFLKMTAEKEALVRKQSEAFIKNILSRAAESEKELMNLKQQVQEELITRKNPQQDESMNPSQGSVPGVDPSQTSVLHGPISSVSYTSGPSAQPSSTSNVSVHPMPATLPGYTNNQTRFESPGSQSQNLTSPFAFTDSGVDSRSISQETDGRNTNMSLDINGVIWDPVALTTSSPGSAMAVKPGPSPMERQEKALQEEQRRLDLQLRKLQARENSLKQSSMGYPRRTPDMDEMTVVTDITDNSEQTLDISMDTEQDQEEVMQAYRQAALNSSNRPNKTTTGSMLDKKGASKPGTDRQRYRDALFCVFMYLDSLNLGEVALVCKEWRDISRHPALWRKITLQRARVSAKYLTTLAGWCTELQSLTLEGLRGRPRTQAETPEEYYNNIRGSLEPGLEQLLINSQHNLVSLRISDCGNILTDRSLWLASCHARHLERLAYVSDSEPARAEVIYALGAGCRNISTLIIPPMFPNKRPSRFTNRCVQMIGKCWPQLRVLCLGGIEVSAKGLVSVARACPRLQIVELDHMLEVTEDLAVRLCHEGLKGLEELHFTFTPVTPKAVLHFVSACAHLTSLRVSVGISDYYDDTVNPQHQRTFKEIATKLHSLEKRSGLQGIVKIKTDYG